MQNSAILIIQHIIQVVKKVMARTKRDNIQINISIPAGWKIELKTLHVSILLRKVRVSYFLTCFVLKISDTVSHHQVF